MISEMTEELRANVINCVEKAVANGFQIVRGEYVKQDQCCAIGAISMCEKSAGSGRGRAVAFALSLRHLGCTPYVLESIEAGFENWHNTAHVCRPYCDESGCIMGSDHDQHVDMVSRSHGWDVESWELGKLIRTDFGLQF